MSKPLTRKELAALLDRAAAAMMVEHEDAHRAHLQSRYIEGPWAGRSAPRPSHECHICALDIEIGWALGVFG